MQAEFVNFRVFGVGICQPIPEGALRSATKDAGGVKYNRGKGFKLQFIGLKPDKPQMMCAAGGTAGAMKFALAK